MLQQLWNAWNVSLENMKLILFPVNVSSSKPSASSSKKTSAISIRDFRENLNKNSRTFFQGKQQITAGKIL